MFSLHFLSCRAFIKCSEVSIIEIKRDFLVLAFGNNGWKATVQGTPIVPKLTNQDRWGQCSWEKEDYVLYNFLQGVLDGNLLEH